MLLEAKSVVDPRPPPAMILRKNTGDNSGSTFVFSSQFLFFERISKFSRLLFSLTFEGIEYVMPPITTSAFSPVEVSRLT